MNGSTEPIIILPQTNMQYSQTKFTGDEKIIEVLPKQPEPEKQKRPTYALNWSAYDAAKTNEDVYFKRFLQELFFFAIEEPPNNKPGRKGFSKKDKLFAMCVKIYYRSDLRKATSILKELQHLKFIQKVPCFKSIDNFFNDKELTAILDKLILISALPLSNVEETGAIDATGFSTSQFENWFNYKWGKRTGKERIWRKAHACSCCKTNIFISIKITEKNVADAPMFEEVVADHPKYFKMEDFVADKAYLSRDILKAIQKLGLNPYIPFKKNSIGDAKSAFIWRKMFEEFTYNKEEYMKKYHRRSNIETSFHMLKQRFGHHCATKNFQAQTNEIKVKVLCHNICVLIAELFEQQIDIDFEACVKTAISV